MTPCSLVDSENSRILACLRELHEKNRIHELLIRIEEICSKYGSCIISLEKYPGQIPYINIADPYMLSTVCKFIFEERAVVLYNYLAKDTKTYPVKEVYTEKTVKRT